MFLPLNSAYAVTGFIDDIIPLLLSFFCLSCCLYRLDFIAFMSCNNFPEIDQ